MTDPYGIEVVLLGLDEMVWDSEIRVGRLGTSVDETASRLDHLERRLAELTGEPVVARDDPFRPVRGGRQKVVPPGSRPASLDDLLGKSEAEAVERRFRRETTLRANLDRYDVMAAITAGLVGAMVDFVVVQIPKDSSLTNWLRSQAVDSDNWIADMAKVPYDQVVGTGVEVLGPLSHRVQTLGHDPLLGLVFGTADIMQGRMTATGRTGGLHLVSSPLPGVESVVEAMGIQVMHLISDVGTSTGLPIPGWGLLSANGATVGGRSVAEIAREMYVRGYDSWHLLSMSTVPASVELSCRLYWGLRSSLDPSFEQQTDSVGDDPRYQAISLLAHGVAAACDAAQFAITGNPLTLNWAEWMVFAKKLSDWLKATSPRPTTLLAQQFTANRQYLDSGWDRVWAGSVPELPLHKVC